MLCNIKHSIHNLQYSQVCSYMTIFDVKSENPSGFS